MSQHILQLQFDDDGDLDDDIGNDVGDDGDDVNDDGDDGDDVGDDDGKEAKTTPGSDLYWPALPGASGGIKPSELYCSNIRNVVSIYLSGSTIYFVGGSTSMDLPSTVWVDLPQWIYHLLCADLPNQLTLLSQQQCGSRPARTFLQISILLLQP